MSLSKHFLTLKPCQAFAFSRNKGAFSTHTHTHTVKNTKENKYKHTHTHTQTHAQNPYTHLASMISSTYFPGPGALAGFGGLGGLPPCLISFNCASVAFMLDTHGFHTCKKHLRARQFIPLSDLLLLRKRGLHAKTHTAFTPANSISGLGGLSLV
jgi:hypothetical protein